MIYVASPYSHPDPIVRKTRYLLARDFIVHLVATEHLIAFSPIVYGHELSVNYNFQVPTDAQFWLAFNTNMIRRSEAMFLLKLRDWEESKGMTLEINLARMLQLPVVEFDHDFNNLTELNAKFQVQSPSIIIPN